MCLCHRDHFYMHQPGKTLVSLFKMGAWGNSSCSKEKWSSLRTAPRWGCPLPTLHPTWGCFCSQEGPPVLRKGLWAEMLLEKFASQCSMTSLHGGGPSPGAVLLWDIMLPRRQFLCCQSTDFQCVSNILSVSFPLTGLVSCYPWRCSVSIPPRQGMSYGYISWLQINSALTPLLLTIAVFSNILRFSLKSVATQKRRVMIPGLQCTALGAGNSPAGVQIRNLKKLGSNNSPLGVRLLLYLIWQPEAFNMPARYSVSMGVKCNASVFPLASSREEHISVCELWLVSCLLDYFRFLWSLKDWHQLGTAYESVLMFLVWTETFTVASKVVSHTPFWLQLVPEWRRCLEWALCLPPYHIYFHALSGHLLPSALGRVQGSLRLLVWGASAPLGDLWDSSSGGQEVLCLTLDSYLLAAGL